jgi:hypothetical protein
VSGPPADVVGPGRATPGGALDGPSARVLGARAAGTVLVLFALFGLPFARIGDTIGPGRRALDAHPEVALLVVGDSRPHVAISPARLSAELRQIRSGLPILNVAEDGTDTLHQSWLVREAFDRARAHPPAVIVWAVDPQGFDGSRLANRLERVPGRALPWLVQAGAPLELGLDVALGAIYPPYRHRPMVKEKVEGVTDRIGAVAARLETAWLGLVAGAPKVKGRLYEPQPDGWEPFVVTADGPGRFARGLAAYEVDAARYRLSDWHFELVRRAVREARARGAVVVFLEMPVAPVYRERFGGLARYEAWERRMQGLAAEEGQIFLSQVEQFATPELFGDPGHLTRAGAEAYMPVLAEALSQRPPVVAALATW